MAFSGTQKTRLGLSATTRTPVTFTAKAASGATFQPAWAKNVNTLFGAGLKNGI